MKDDPSEEVPECLDCGTCCYSTLDRYIRLTGDDHARIGDEADRLTVFIGNRCFMAMSEGHCAALVVDREGGRFVCSIYERRPELCRTLERGSPQCLGERDLKADRPKKSLRLV